MEDGGFTVVKKKSKKCVKNIPMPPEGSKESIVKALKNGKNSISESGLDVWIFNLIERIREENKIGKLFVVGNGNFDASYWPGAHQLSLCLILAEKYNINLFFQEIACNQVENQYLSSLPNVEIIGVHPGFCRPISKSEESTFELVVMIHGIHELLNDYLHCNWGENLKRIILICNDYPGLGVVSSETSNLAALNKYIKFCSSKLLPKYAPNSTFFSETSILFVSPETVIPSL